MYYTVSLDDILVHACIKYLLGKYKVLKSQNNKIPKKQKNAAQITKIRIV